MPVGTVEVGYGFFVKERNAYSNWKGAFWREMFQNSVDAILSNGNRGRIDVTITPYDSGCIVQFNDNGCGMNHDVIEGVFMRLGETTKSGGSTGGFGRARILTHFSMEEYAIATQDQFVHGSGSSYNIDQSSEWINGCHQKIHVDADSLCMERSLEEYLSMSHLYVDVYVNGERWVKWGYRRNKTRELTWGSVYVNKSGKHKHCLIVRVNGTFMFYRYIEANAQVIVEINPDISREVLTSNRDGISGKNQEELDKFVSELASDTKSALKNKLKSKTRVRKGSGSFYSRAKANELAAKVQAGEDIGDEGRKIIKIAYSNATVGADPSQSGLCDMADTILEHKDIHPEPRTNMHDVILIDDTDNQKVRAIFDSYDPLNWKKGHAKGRPFNIGGSKYKILTAWRIAIQECLMLLQNEFECNDVVWGVGWYFSDDALACLRMSDGTPYFAINPVFNNGKMRYRLHADSYAAMIATAAHEVVHLMEKRHDERFASLYTKLMERVVGETKGILRKMKEAVAEAEIPLDTDDDWN